MRPFADRREAGLSLARLLERHRGSDAIVLGLPRGGVPVAAVIARQLGLPLDVLLVRKLGHPLQPELAIGAIGEDDVIVWNHDLPSARLVDEEARARIVRLEKDELDRRVALYRPHRRAPVDLAGRTAIIVDDGIATGATARAAVAVARAHGAPRVVLATPVIVEGVRREFGTVVDELVAVRVPKHFASVSGFYADFSPTEDDEVVAILADRSP